MNTISPAVMRGFFIEFFWSQAFKIYGIVPCIAHLYFLFRGDKTQNRQMLSKTLYLTYHIVPAADDAKLILSRIFTA